MSNVSSVAAAGFPPPAAMPIPVHARQPVSGLPCGVAHLEVLGVLDVKGELLRPAVDPVVHELLAHGAEPLAEDDGVEANLAARAEADLDGDFVEAGLAGILGLDVALERAADCPGEIAAGELLGALVERLIVVGDVNGSVWHVRIVAPACADHQMRMNIRIDLHGCQHERLRWAATRSWVSARSGLTISSKERWLGFRIATQRCFA